MCNIIFLLFNNLDDISIIQLKFIRNGFHCIVAFLIDCYNPSASRIHPN
jgi:hypothetical protein